MQNKKILLLFSAAGLFMANFAKAVCPVCVVAVGAGLGLSRWLGIDDTISSLWMGGLLAALSMWTMDFLRKKGWRFKFDDLAIWLIYYALVLLPLSYYDIIGHYYNKIFGIDKILFGTILGTLVFLGAVRFNLYLKDKNNGKGYFPYQKVAVPFGILIICSLIIYFLI